MTKLKFKTLESVDDLTPYLDDDELSSIANQVIQGYEVDEKSRETWKETIDLAMKIATQKIEVKNTPWENASNTKFPLITMACQDFTSNVIPNLLPNGEIVKFTVQGRDPDNAKFQRGNRVTSYMNYQCQQGIKGWIEGIEKMATYVPLWGIVFKKTYYDTVCKEIKSVICAPDKIVVNHGIETLDTARRITHIIQTYVNEVITNQRAGIYNKDIDATMLHSAMEDYSDKDFKIELHEQYCFLDLDDDGYKEPYIVTVHKDTRKVLRVVNNFKKVVRNDKNEVLYIEPEMNYTDFHCFHNPDGGFYSIGYGAMLLSINSSINTIQNQLIDAGTLNNNQSGFIGRGLKLRSGDIRLKMGEWKPLDVASGTTLAQNIYPLPTKEPSSTLYALWQELIKIGKDLSSSTDIMKGSASASNVATGTADLLHEQGGKNYKTVTTRLLRSLKSDFLKIYDLNFKYLSNKEYRNFLDDPRVNVKMDFEENTLDIIPAADPTLSSMIQRVTKAQILGNLPTVDRREADRYLLESMQLDPMQIEKLQPPPQPQPPSAQDQELIAKSQLYGAQAQQVMSSIGLDTNKLSLEMAKFKQDSMESNWRINEAGSRIWKSQKDALHNDQKQQTTITKMTSEQMRKQQEQIHKQQMDAVNAELSSTKLALDKHKIDTKAAVDITKIASSNKDKQESEMDKPAEDDSND